MATCSNCGAETNVGDAFCGECGAPMRRTEPGPSFPQTSEMTPPWASEQPSHAATVTPPPARSEATGARAIASQALPDTSGESELLGQAAPNQQYLGQRLLYQQGDAESLDPVSPRFVKAILVHALIVYVVWAVGAIVLAVVFEVAVGSSALTFLVVGLWWLVMGIVFWWSPVWVSLSEWKFMLDGQAQSANAAFEHIAWVFKRRATPVTGLKVQRLSLGAGASRDYLYVQDHVFRGYVSSFAYGNDLYVGWSLWWRISPVHWLWIAFVRIYHAITLRGFELQRIHRYDNAKALREALHGAAREGLDAVSGMVSFAGRGTIGSEIPIEVVQSPQTGSTPAYR